MSHSWLARTSSRLFYTRPKLARLMSIDDSSSSFSILDSLVPILFRVGTITIGLVAVAAGLLYTKQESLLYFPEIGGIPRSPQNNPRGYRSPGERQIPFDNVRIRCTDGVEIHAWLLWYTDINGNKPPSTPTIIFFHGNAGNIGLRLPNALQMRQYTRSNVLMVEYRGYGDSDDVSPTEAGLRLDAEAALHWALSNTALDTSRLFLFGRSLGGAVAFHLADYAERKQLPLAGMMIENTFTSISAMVDKLMPFLTPIKLLVLKIGWDSSKLAGHLTTPVLYLAGSSDELVPHDHMQELTRLSEKQSKLVQVHIIEGGTHNDSWLHGGAAYWDAMVGFMQKAVSGSSGGARISTSVGGGGAAVESSIPIMSSSFLNMAKDAVGTGRQPKVTDKKEK